MKKFLLILTMVLVIAILFGCASENSNSTEKVYGKEDTNITVKVGEEFTLKLEENPTTGFQWFYTINDEKIIELTNDDYVPDSRDEDVVGSGGNRILTFKATSKGSTLINMVYEQSWEKNEDNETVTFYIEVK